MWNNPKLSDLKKGDKIEVDGGFECMFGIKEIDEDEDGLFVPCSHGKHYLDGQLDFGGGDILIGIRKIL
jgi:hypothetical protein